MRHLIERQEFDLVAPSVRVARQWESRAPFLLSDVITPCIERCFDEAADDGSRLVISRLEIDLGVLDPLVTRDRVIERVTREVTRALRSHSAGVDPDLSSSADGDSAGTHPSHAKLDSNQAGLALLVHFLEHGTLLWWAEGEADELEGDWVRRISIDEARSVARHLAASESARTRLAQQFSAEFIAALLAPIERDLMRRAFEGWQWLAAGAGSVNRVGWIATVHKHYWLHWISRGVGCPAPEDELIRALARWLDEASESGRATAQRGAEKLLMVGAGESAIPELLRRHLAAAFRRGIGIRQDSPDRTERRGDPTPGEPVGSDGGEDVRLAGANTPALSGDTAARAAEGIAPESEHGAAPGLRTPVGNGGPPEAGSPERQGMPPDSVLYVEAAGVVLAHPFFPELFRAAGLWRDPSGWTSARARHLAVHLVAWLAFGDCEPAEYRLLLPKLLCGMPWDEVLDTTIALDEEHRGAGTDLLEAIVGHWAALGNASIDGVREAFVLRSGRLSARPDGWLLTVERKAQDVLLGRLPWGISLVHLPWLQGTRIHVDWP